MSLLLRNLKSRWITTDIWNLNCDFLRQAIHTTHFRWPPIDLSESAEVKYPDYRWNCTKIRTKLKRHKSTFARFKWHVAFPSRYIKTFYGLIPGISPCKYLSIAYPPLKPLFILLKILQFLQAANTDYDKNDIQLGSHYSSATSAQQTPPASEFQRRNRVGCTKLGQVMKVVLTTKTHDTSKNRLYISLRLFDSLTYFSVQFWSTNLEREILTLYCCLREERCLRRIIKRAQTNILFSLAYLLIIRSK